MCMLSTETLGTARERMAVSTDSHKYFNGLYRGFRGYIGVM